MRAIQISRWGGPEVLELVELPAPPMIPGGVRVAVKAAGVNFADLMMRMGLYPEAPKRPFVPGYEIAGTVTEVAPGETGYKAGDRVVAGTRFGGYASEVVLPAAQLRRIPENLTEVQAAAIPVNFLTAWTALHDMARVRKGDRVIIPSAAGGVGTAAVQLAARAGARVTGLVGSPAKADLVRKLGAAEVLTNDDWAGGDDAKLGGYDVILDASNGESLKRAYRRLAPAGRVVEYGAASIVTGDKRSLLKAAKMMLTLPRFHPMKLMNDNRGVFGLNVLQLFEPKGLPLMFHAFDGVLKMFEEGQLEAVVGRIFPIEDAGLAHSHLASRGNRGKVVLTFD